MRRCERTLRNLVCAGCGDFLLKQAISAQAPARAGARQVTSRRTSRPSCTVVSEVPSPDSMAPDCRS